MMNLTKECLERFNKKHKELMLKVDKNLIEINNGLQKVKQLLKMN